MTPLQKGCFATGTTEFFEFFSRVFSVNSVAELVFAVNLQILTNSLAIKRMPIFKDDDPSQHGVSLDPL